MRIVVIGAGAMGEIYGGRLSLNNEVTLVDKNSELVEHINKNGVTLEENGEDISFFPAAVTDTKDMEQADLIILFVKAFFSRSALETNKSLIGADTCVMTLQNGSGHEDILREFVSDDRIIIGTTQDQGTVLGTAHIRHGGDGTTNIGMLQPDTGGILPRIKENFDSCGFKTNVYDNIQQLVWNKLFTNVSLSAVTAALQVKMGFIAENGYALELTKMLLHEAVSVAHAMGLEADEDALIKEIVETSRRVPDGVTSICADIGKGRRTEVDTISGSVVRAAKKAGVQVPCHVFMVNLIHAMESRDSDFLN